MEFLGCHWDDIGRILGCRSKAWRNARSDPPPNQGRRARWLDRGLLVPSRVLPKPTFQSQGSGSLSLAALSQILSRRLHIPPGRPHLDHLWSIFAPFGRKNLPSNTSPNKFQKNMFSPGKTMSFQDSPKHVVSLEIPVHSDASLFKIDRFPMHGSRCRRMHA